MRIRRIGVYIRRYVVLLAWYGALSVRWERCLKQMQMWRELKEYAGLGYIRFLRRIADET